MLRKLFLLSVLISSVANADIKFDFNFNRYYSVPAHPTIDQDQYNNLMLTVGIMMAQAWNNGAYGKKVHQQIDAYLKNLRSPTALRLMADLNKNN